MLGRIMFRSDITFLRGAGEVKVSTAAFPAGVYNVEVLNADGNRASAKVIINR